MTETMTSKMNVYPNLLKEFIKSILYSLISVGGNIFLTDKQFIPFVSQGFITFI